MVSLRSNSMGLNESGSTATAVDVLPLVHKNYKKLKRIFGDSQGGIKYLADKLDSKILPSITAKHNFILSLTNGSTDHALSGCSAAIVNISHKTQIFLNLVADDNVTTAKALDGLSDLLDSVEKTLKIMHDLDLSSLLGEFQDTYQNIKHMMLHMISEVAPVALNREWEAVGGLFLMLEEDKLVDFAGLSEAEKNIILVTLQVLNSALRKIIVFCHDVEVQYALPMGSLSLEPADVLHGKSLSELAENVQQIYSCFLNNAHYTKKLELYPYSVTLHQHAKEHYQLIKRKYHDDAYMGIKERYHHLILCKDKIEKIKFADANLANASDRAQIIDELHEVCQEYPFFSEIEAKYIDSKPVNASRIFRNIREAFTQTTKEAAMANELMVKVGQEIELAAAELKQIDDKVKRYADMQATTMPEAMYRRAITNITLLENAIAAATEGGSEWNKYQRQLKRYQAIARATQNYASMDVETPIKDESFREFASNVAVDVVAAWREIRVMIRLLVEGEQSTIHSMIELVKQADKLFQQALKPEIYQCYFTGVLEDKQGPLPRIEMIGRAMVAANMAVNNFEKMNAHFKRAEVTIIHQESETPLSNIQKLIRAGRELIVAARVIQETAEVLKNEYILNYKNEITNFIQIDALPAIEKMKVMAGSGFVQSVAFMEGGSKADKAFDTFNNQYAAFARKYPQEREVRVVVRKTFDAAKRVAVATEALFKINPITFMDISIFITTYYRDLSYLSANLTQALRSLHEVMRQELLCHLWDAHQVFEKIIAWIDKTESDFYLKPGFLNERLRLSDITFFDVVKKFNSIVRLYGFEFSQNVAISKEKEKILERMDFSLIKLKRERQHYYLFFNARKRIKLENKIAGLEMLQTNYAEPGVTMNEALNRLNANAEVLHNALISDHLKLVYDVKKMDDEIKNHGSKIIGPRPVVQEGFSLFAVDLIQARINVLNKEKESNYWFYRTKERKIQLLEVLKNDLESNLKTHSFKQVVDSIRQSEEHAHDFYLLFQGRTGKLMRQIELGGYSHEQMLRLIDLEIARLKYRQSNITFFFVGYRQSLLQDRIDALSALKQADGDIEAVEDDQLRKILQAKEDVLLLEIASCKHGSKAMV